MDFGEAPLFSSSRIVGNLTQFLAPTRPQVLTTLHDTPGCLQYLAGLLLARSQTGAEIKDTEIKYNVIASLSALLQDSDIAALVASGAVLGLVYMLRTTDELAQQHVVQLLKKMVKHQGCRDELRRSRESISLLFESSADITLRYSVLEIVSELAQHDVEVLNFVPEGGLVTLVRVLTEELPSSFSKSLLLDILTHVAAGSSKVSFYSMFMLT